MIADKMNSCHADPDDLRDLQDPKNKPSCTAMTKRSLAFSVPS